MLRTFRIVLLCVSVVALYPTLYLVGKRDGVRMFQPRLDELQKEVDATNQRILEENTCTRDFAAWKNTHQRWAIDVVSTYPDKSRKPVIGHGGGFASQKECDKQAQVEVEMNASMIEYEKKHHLGRTWPDTTYTCTREW